MCSAVLRNCVNCHGELWGPIMGICNADYIRFTCDVGLSTELWGHVNLVIYVIVGHRGTC